MKTILLSCLMPAFVLAALAPVAAQQRSIFVERAGCVFKVAAYVDPAYKTESSRYSLELFQQPSDPYRWDFTLDGRDESPYTNIHGAISATPYAGKTKTTIRARLRQYDTLEERVTFKNLALLPVDARLPSSRVTSRFLQLSQAVSATTPSGITVTLPAQGTDTFGEVFGGVFNGNANALFFQIEVSPDKRENLLNSSPLYRKHLRPVRIKLECVAPNFLVWHQADNTFKTIAIDIPRRETATRLDELTLLIRQRVEVSAVPVSFDVPISRPKP